MFGSILQRMILWELTKVFLMSLVGITGILLMAGIIAEASQQGLGPTQILAAIPLLVPSTLPYTIPATTLFATCVVYGRLSADNEILAVKSAGINALTVVRPGILLGLAMSTATLGLYYRIIPYTHYLLRAMVFNDAQELLYSLLKKHHEIKYSSFPYQIFVKGVKDKKLIEPIFKRKDANGAIDWVAHAREAELQVRPSAGQVDVLVKHCVVWGDSSSAVLEDRPFTVELPRDFGKQTQPRPRDLTWQEIIDRKAALQKEIKDIRVNAAKIITIKYFQGDTEALAHYLKSCNDKIDVVKQEIVALDVEVQMRPALSLGCLFFILVGCPVGIWFSRSDYLSAFITCFLPIVFVYYPLMLCGTGLAKEAKINTIPLIWGANPNMILLVWGADAVVGLIGVILFWHLLKN